MIIFITGASGFIGGVIASRLKEEHNIFAMARSVKPIIKIKNLGITPVKCSLNHVTKEDLQDIDIVIHAAAKVQVKYKPVISRKKGLKSLKKYNLNQI